MFGEKISGAKHDRPDLTRMIDQFRWVNTTSPAGRIVLTVFAGSAEFERELISQCTGTGRVGAGRALRPPAQAHGRSEHVRRTPGRRWHIRSRSGQAAQALSHYLYQALEGLRLEKCAMLSGRVVAVARDGEHRFSKHLVANIKVVRGLGVEGDAHQGTTVKHRSRVAADPTQPNLRQVHLIHSELFEELRGKGFKVRPAELGENITTEGIDLLALPRSTLLLIGTSVVLQVTGLRNPCAQIERFHPGLLAAVLDRGPNDQVIRKAGIMTVVREGGVVRPGDPITTELPPPPHLFLERV